MTADKIKVATFNANSVRIRLEQVLDWLEREEADILCIQETKVQDHEFPQMAFEEAGYHVIFRGQKGYAGVATVSRREPQNVSFGLGDGLEEEEQARLIRADIDGIAVINTYVPQGRDIESPHFRYKLEWLSRLRALFERCYSPDQPVLWMGDLNVALLPIDVYDPKRLANHVDYHPEARAALERVCSWGFEDVFRRFHPDEPEQYTYWDYRARNPVENKVGWRIDHIMATRPLAERAISSWIDVEARLVERPSDHTFLVAEFSR
ncbi:MAG TPA: exodeoxyribonuclease III [Chloroflexi bacterium]|jgi:exodeoxyribonuclease-3|nr:exodeoxyribonuclease III [Chloroflexota bacterium]